MTEYRVIIQKNYTEWYYTNDMNQIVTLPIDINPITYKLFNNDKFIINSNDINIVESNVRCNKNIPGILVLENNKTFGKTAKGKLLYRCIPDDTTLPTFLIPYEIKNIGFNKTFTNMYVFFHYMVYLLIQ